MKTFISRALFPVSIFAAWMFTTCRYSQDEKAAPVVSAAEIRKNRVNNDVVWDSLHRQLEFDVSQWYRLFILELRYDSALWYAQHMDTYLPDMFKYKSDSFVLDYYSVLYGAIGNCQGLTGDTEAGLENLRKGYELVLKYLEPSNLHVGGACVGFAANYAIRGDYENAIFWQQKGLLWNQKYRPGDPFEGNWHWNTAFYQTQQGNYADAVGNYKKAAAIYEHGYPPVYPSACERVADAYLKLERYNEAREWFDRGLAAAAQLPNPTVDQATLYIGLAGLSTALRRYDEAGAYLQKAHTGLSAPEMPPFLISEYYLQSAGLAESRGQFASALQYLQGALQQNKFRCVIQCYDGMSQALGYVQNINVQNHLARLFLKIGAQDSALAVIQRVFKESSPGFLPKSEEQNPALSAIPHSTFLVSTLHQKAVIFSEKYQKHPSPSDLQSTLQTYRLGIAFIDKLARGLKWENSKFTLLDRAVPLYEDFIAFLYSLHQKYPAGPYAEEAFAVADKCKAVTLLEKLNRLENQRFAGMPDSFRHREAELMREISFLEHRLVALKNNAAGNTTTSLAEYQSRLLTAKNRYDSLLTGVSRQNSDFYRLRFAGNSATAAQLRTRVLKSNNALLEFFSGDSALYTFCLTLDGLRFHRTALDSNLQADIRRFTRMGDYDDFAPFAHTARSLYEHLLAPVLPPDPRIDRLVVIPDGPLGYLPFHLLLERAPEAQTLAARDWRTLPYLLKTKYVRYEYSAALLLEKRPHKLRERLYAGFAPAFSGQPLASRGADSLVLSRYWRGGVAPDLKNNRPEVRAVAALTEGRSFLENAATEQAFKQQAPGCNILHLATHACTDDSDPLYSQILFSPVPGDSSEDGSLHAYELYNMRLDADLAVLSACRTGAGKVQRGEGIMSLSRAFKYAGCPNIVMSLWNADDVASREIMVSFFQNLKDGLGKDEALCRAQRDFLKNATQETARPSRWATFVLVGDDATVPFHSDRWLVLAVAVMFAGLILYLFFGPNPRLQE